MRILGLSKRPERDAAEFGMESIGRTALALLRAPQLRPDLIVWGGGQLLQDDTSQVKNPYWALILQSLALSCRSPIIACGLGIGPLETRWGRWWAGRALGSLSWLGVRDAVSAGLAESLGMGPSPVRVPDLALALEQATPAEAERYLADTEGVPRGTGERRVGVVLRNWFHVSGNVLPYRWSERSGLCAQRGRDSMARCVRHCTEALNMVSRQHRVRYLLVPFSDAPWDRDHDLLAGMARELEGPAHVLGLRCTAAMAGAVLGSCDLVVSARLHGTLLALGAGRPIFALPYAAKVRDLLATMGLPGLGLDAVAAEGGAQALARGLERSLSAMDEGSGQAAVLRRRLAAGLVVYRECLERHLGPGRPTP